MHKKHVGNIIIPLSFDDKVELIRIIHSLSEKGVLQNLPPTLRPTEGTQVTKWLEGNFMELLRAIDT